MSSKGGHAAFHVKHLRRDKCGGSTEAHRKRLLKEAMRELDEDNYLYQCTHNPNIRPDMGEHNIAFVNNGDGGYFYATSIDQVLNYQNERMKGVRVRKDSFETSLFVVHLPKSMCVEVPPENVNGRKYVYEARDRGEAEKYLFEAAKWLADNLIAGGWDAVSGGDINFDESTPHIQFFADTFDADPKKNDGSLRCAPTRVYGSHRDVRYTEGVRAGQQISGQEKIRRAQEGLRKHMASLGYPVDLEVSAEHERNLNLEQYKEYAERSRVLDDKEADVAFRESRLERATERMNAGFDKQREEIATKRESAFAEGFEEGKRVAEEEYQGFVDDAKADREAAKKKLGEAKADREAAKKKLEEAETDREAARNVLVKTRASVEEDIRGLRARKKAVEDEVKVVENQRDAAVRKRDAALEEARAAAAVQGRDVAKWMLENSEPDKTPYLLYSYLTDYVMKKKPRVDLDSEGVSIDGKRLDYGFNLKCLLSDEAREEFYECILQLQEAQGSTLSIDNPNREAREHSTTLREGTVTEVNKHFEKVERKKKIKEARRQQAREEAQEERNSLPMHGSGGAYGRAARWLYSDPSPKKDDDGYSL